MSSEQPLQVPEDRKESCVGPDSEQAGKAAACQGCPNAALCASGALRGPDPDIPLIAARLRGIKLRLLVLSGKGGVGKSTVTKELAFALARRGLEIGVLDADICGPSQPRMLNARLEDVHIDGQGISPVGVREGVSMMSIHYFMGDDQKNDAVTWRGPQKNNMLKNFLKRVNWAGTAGAASQKQQQQLQQQKQGAADRAMIDCLLIDTPPGTTDEHITLASLLMNIQKTHDEAKKQKDTAQQQQQQQQPASQRQRDNDDDNDQKRGEGEHDGDDDDDVKTCAVVITTPQQVSVNDVRRELSFCVKAKLPILGLVVNMDGFICPCCSKLSQIFPNEGENKKFNAADALAAEFGIPVLGRLPLDPNVMMASDAGVPLVEAEAAAEKEEKPKQQQNGESPAVAAVEDMVDRIMELCDL